MRTNASRYGSVLLLSFLLAGCGLKIPEVQEIWDSDIPAVQSNDGKPVAPKLTGTAQIEYEIVRKVYCELKDAVRAAQLYPVGERATIGDKSAPPIKQQGLIPDKWGAQISLMLEVDESSNLTPGVTFNKVLPNKTTVFGPGTKGIVTSPQSFGLGLGATLSSTATRIDKFNPYYSIKFLANAPTADIVCKPEHDTFVSAGKIPAKSSPLIVESDLGIKDWLLGAMFVDDLMPSEDVKDTTGATTKPESVSYEVKFIIVSNGSITPTWKLLRLTANTSGTLFGLGRTRTHDLIITIGPQTTATANAHLASQIASAVSGGNAAMQTAP